MGLIGGTPEPTFSQCCDNAVMWDQDGMICKAFWYHSNRAVAVVSKGWIETPHGSRVGGCMDIYVWDEGEWRGMDDRAEIHVCDPLQYVKMGEFLEQFLRENQGEYSPSCLS